MKKIQIFEALHTLPEWLGTKVLTVFGIVIVAAGYLVGQSYYSTSLNQFGVDASVFPLEQAGYLVMGLRGFLVFLAGMPDWLGIHWKGACGLIGYALFCGSVGAVSGVYRTKRKLSGDASEPKDRPHNLYVSAIYKTTLPIFSIIVVIFVVVPMFGVALALPAVVGEAAAFYQTGKMKKDFAQGCAKTATVHCVEVTKDGNQMAVGFRLAQSKDRIALYLNGKTTELELAGRVISTVP